MCGIGAIYGKSIADKKSSIRKSLSQVEHRGYSNYEIEVLENCVLGCNRLQIVDKEGGKQPQTNEDNTVFLVLNGEIFNFLELREELIGKGHKFRTNSDTEVLVHLWEEYKEEMVKKIDSEMFAFFLYDKNEEAFFAARDPYGIKPLYYAIDANENYHFASEIKQLAQFDEIETIKEFPSGCFMKNGVIKSYHTMPDVENKIDMNTDKIIQKVRELFDKSVEKRVQTDLPVGVFFSGGIDSAAVLATALKYHDNVTAFTIGHKNSPDMVVAKKYCEEKRIKLITFDPPNEEELSKSIPEIVRISESFEPNLVRASAVYYYVAKLARAKGFRIILCGEGADELFAGYPDFMLCTNEKEISEKIDIFVKDLPRTQFQRVDRIPMHFTLEVRVPFFDTEFADYVLKIPSSLKVKEQGDKKIAKWILRKSMEDRLPDYISNRKKVVLHEGAGYRGNHPTKGMFYDIVKDKVTDKEFGELKKIYSGWNLANKEEAYYFGFFLANKYEKATFNKLRIHTNTIHTVK